MLYGSDKSRQIISWQSAAAIASELEPQFAGGVSFQELSRKMLTFAERQPDTDLYIVTEDGRIEAEFAPIGGSTIEGSIDMVPVRAFLGERGKSLVPLYGSNPRGRDRRPFSVAPIEIKGRKYFVYLVLGNRLEAGLSQRFFDRELISGFIFTVLIITGSSVAAGLLIFYFITRPFSSILGILSRFREGDFSSRLPPGRSDEFGILSDAVNSMADSISSNVSQLEQRDNLRRELVANVAHDLRGPLALIAADTERLRESFGDEDSDGQLAQDYCQNVERNSRMLAKLLTELFDLAKLEAKETVPDRCPVELEELFLELEARYSRATTQRGIRFLVNCEDSLPPAYCDAQLIERALGNLIENALRYVEQDGEIELRAENAHTGVLVSVRDSGCGISEKDVQRIFERNYQVDGRKNNGTSGLGLAIVRRILEAHGSAIRVESREGEGTIFSFQLSFEAATDSLHPA